MLKMYLKILSCYFAVIIILCGVGLNLCTHVCYDCKGSAVHLALAHDHNDKESSEHDCHCKGDCEHKCEDNNLKKDLVLKIDSKYSIKKNVKLVSSKIIESTNVIVLKIKQTTNYVTSIIHDIKFVIQQLDIFKKLSIMLV